MPRPLVIKIESHKSQSNKKATGSIDVQLLKGINKANMYEAYNSETDNAPHDQINTPEETGSNSIVRNLISRYETPTDKANLIKYKSKSLADLQKPQIPNATKKAQGDVYNKGRYNEEPVKQQFDFKNVFSKFETSSHTQQKRTTITSTNHSVAQVKSYKPYYNNDSLNLVNIKQRAKDLLEQHRREHEFSSWDDRVVELLQQIQYLDSYANSSEVNREWRSSNVKKSEEQISSVTYKQENTIQRAKSLDHGELNKNLKVKDIKNIFEAKIDKPISRPVSSHATTYFGVKPVDAVNTHFKSYSLRGVSATPFNGDFNNNQTESERSEDSDDAEENFYDVDFVNRKETSDVIEGNRIITQPVLISYTKTQDLDLLDSEPDVYVPYQSYIQNGNDEFEETDKEANYFDHSESEDIHVVENRMLPPPKMVVVASQPDGAVKVNNSKERIEELKKDIEDYAQQITNLSEDNKEEGSYLNEVLIRILIKLDDIKTYGDAVILTERRKAIQFVQSCITKLKEKVKGTE